MEPTISAIEEVQNANPGAHKFHITNTHKDFLEGTLYEVAFMENEQSWHNYVYHDSTGLHLAKNASVLIPLISKKAPKHGWIDSIGGITGVLALIITCTIAYLVIWAPSIEIPDTFSAALTTILGFYFGSQVKK